MQPTTAALAESIGVSRRTVLRELPAVEQWMQAAGAHFVRNPGKGLLLDEAPERRDALRTQLNSSDRKELSLAERRQQLLTRLLSEQEPCKTAVLARALGVSESTLSADLDELETKLHPYRVEMFRRPGVGVWLQGDASSYRRVVSALLRSSMPEKELAEVLCGRMPENEIFSTLLDTKTAEKVWAVLQQFEQEEQLHLPDAGFLALAMLIYTSGLSCAMELAKLEKPHVSLPGGRLNRFSLSVCGAQSIQTMEGINFDLLLLGVTSYSPETGFTCGVEDEARLKQTVLRRCDCEQKAVLLDSSKIGLKSTFHICELSDIDIVISDGKLPVEFLQACRNAGVTVL